MNAPPPPPLYTLDIDDRGGGNNSCSLSDVAECSIILDKNTPPSEFLPDYNTVYRSGDTRIFSQSHPLPLITEHKHPFGLKNPKFQCFFNSVLQLIFSIFRNNVCNSKDVDALKFQLVRHDIFYNGQNQQGSTECLLMLINIIDKGSMPDSSSTTSPMGASLSDLLFSFVCEVCGLRSPSFESSSVLHISPTDTPFMQNLILEGLQQKLQKSCSRCNKNTRHIESSYILQPPKYLLLFVNRFRYLNDNITKDRCPIPLDATVMLGPLKFNLQATIDHHGPSIDSGHCTPGGGGVLPMWWVIHMCRGFDPLFSLWQDRARSFWGIFLIHQQQSYLLGYKNYQFLQKSIFLAPNSIFSSIFLGPIFSSQRHTPISFQAEYPPPPPPPPPPGIALHLSIVAKKHSIATITKLRSLELPINGLTHDFWTRTGGWEFDRSHGAGTSSPSHWQQVEEQAQKPVGWTMCFLLMTLVPVQKLCVNIYVYIYVHSLYEFCYRSYIQRECHSVLAKLHPITFCRGVRGSWSECNFVFSLVYQLCLALW